jgi:hypothetical protein
MKTPINEIKRMQQLAGLNEGALMDTYEFQVTGTIKVGPAYGASNTKEAEDIVRKELENILNNIEITPL